MAVTKSWSVTAVAAAGAGSLAALSLAAMLAQARRARRRRAAGESQSRGPHGRTVQLPAWLRHLQESPSHYRVLMREWEDLAWRKEQGWRGADLIHGEGSAVHIPCYFYSPEEKALRGPVIFGPGSESHHGLCHGGAMTSALDDVLGHVCFLGAGAGPWSGATVQVNCQLKRPVAVHQTLLLEGRVARQEKNKVFIEGNLKDQDGLMYATMEGLSITGAKLQKEESALERREWRYDDERRIVYDSGWEAEPSVAPSMGG